MYDIGKSSYSNLFDCNIDRLKLKLLKVVCSLGGVRVNAGGIGPIGIGVDGGYPSICTSRSYENVPIRGSRPGVESTDICTYHLEVCCRVYINGTRRMRSLVATRDISTIDNDFCGCVVDIYSIPREITHGTARECQGVDIFIPV
jgi:hypothetical protein